MKLTILLLFFTFPILAQEASVEWITNDDDFPKVGFDYGRFQLEMFSIEEQRIASVISNAKKMDYYYEIGPDGQFNNSEDYELDAKYTLYQKYHYITTKSGSFRIASIRNIRKNTWTFYASQFKSGKFSEPQRVGFYQAPESNEFYPMGLWKKEDIWTNLAIQVAISTDSTKVAFGCLLEHSRRKIKDKYAVFVFNENMTLVNEIVHDIAVSWRDLAPERLFISNKGNAYFLATHQKKVEGRPHTYQLWSMTAAEMLVTDITIGKEIVPANGAIVFSDKTEAISLVGLYQGDRHIEGVYSAKISKDGTLSEVKTAPLNEELLAKMDDSKDAMPIKGNKQYIRESFQLPNGDIQFITEYFVQTSYNGYPYYDYGNILVITLSLNGTLVDEHLIRRNNIPFPAAKKSYLALNKENITYLLYESKEKYEFVAINPYKEDSPKQVLFTARDKGIKANWLCFEGRFLKENQILFGGTISNRGQTWSKVKFGYINLSQN